MNKKNLLICQAAMVSLLPTLAKAQMTQTEFSSFVISFVQVIFIAIVAIGLYVGLAKK